MISRLWAFFMKEDLISLIIVKIAQIDNYIAIVIYKECRFETGTPDDFIEPVGKSGMYILAEDVIVAFYKNKDFCFQVLKIFRGLVPEGALLIDRVDDCPA